MDSFDLFALWEILWQNKVIRKLVKAHVSIQYKYCIAKPALCFDYFQTVILLILDCCRISFLML